MVEISLEDLKKDAGKCPNFAPKNKDYPKEIRKLTCEDCEWDIHCSYVPLNV